MSMPLKIDKVVASQKGHVRRKRYLIAMRNGVRLDRTTGLAFPWKIAWLACSTLRAETQQGDMDDYWTTQDDFKRSGVQRGTSFY